MTTVRQVLQSKGGETIALPPEATVYQALQLMAEKNIGAILVLDTAGRLAGIFSERDYARKVALKGLNSKSVTLAELMTRNVYAVLPDEPLEKCMQIFSAKHIRHLPVVEGGKLLGMISIGDVVKNLLHEKEATIQQLEQYLLGPSYPGGAPN